MTIRILLLWAAIIPMAIASMVLTAAESWRRSRCQAALAPTTKAVARNAATTMWASR